MQALYGPLVDRRVDVMLETKRQSARRYPDQHTFSEVEGMERRDAFIKNFIHIMPLSDR